MGCRWVVSEFQSWWRGTVDNSSGDEERLSRAFVACWIRFRDAFRGVGEEWCAVTTAVMVAGDTVRVIRSLDVRNYIRQLEYQGERCLLVHAGR